MHAISSLILYLVGRTLRCLGPGSGNTATATLQARIEQLTLENLALTHENRILKRSKRRIQFTRLDRLLLGWFSEHLPNWQHLLVTARPATRRGWWMRRRRLAWRPYQ